MRKLCIMIAGLGCCVPSLTMAETAPLPLNKVELQIAGEKWAVTDTARVIVSVNAILDKAGLSRTQQHIMSQLGQIAKVEWHITQFNRVKDPSELERVNIVAEARIKESNLPGLRDRAKNVSKPGQKFTIAQVDFTPSLTDFEKTRNELRNQLYNQAKQELGRLNQVYPNQHFVIHTIDFTPDMPAPSQRFQKQRMTMVAEAAVAPGGVAVSNKVVMTAQVEYAADTFNKAKSGQ